MRTSSRKKIGILLIIIAVISLIAIIVLFLIPEKNPFSGPSEEKSSGEKVLSPQEKFELEREKEAGLSTYTFDEEEEENREWDKDDFRQLARSFAERFGSYSNQSDFKNIEDLRIFMSSDMKSWAYDYVSELRADREYSEDFYGITTRALIEPQIILFDIDNKEVEVLVSTQREEISATDKGDVYEQEIEIKFIKEEGEWLVDSAFWK